VKSGTPSEQSLDEHVTTCSSIYDEYAIWYAAKVDQLIHRRSRQQLLDFIGDVRGQRILDVACGEGSWARELDDLGAHVSGVDISTALVEIAQQTSCGRNIDFIVDDARSLSAIDDASFDRALLMMAIMDMVNMDSVFRAVHRVTRPGGSLDIVLLHPCFESPFAESATDDRGPLLIVRRYLTEGVWQSNGDGVRGRVGARHRTLSTLMNALVSHGWNLVKMQEISAPDAGTGTSVSEIPHLLCIECVSSAIAGGAS